MGCVPSASHLAPFWRQWTHQALLPACEAQQGNLMPTIQANAPTQTHRLVQIYIFKQRDFG